jgi:predicted GNAT superfamily acetyltransferase
MNERDTGVLTVCIATGLTNTHEKLLDKAELAGHIFLTCNVHRQVENARPESERMLQAVGQVLVDLSTRLEFRIN